MGQSGKEDKVTSSSKRKTAAWIGKPEDGKHLEVSNSSSKERRDWWKAQASALGLRAVYEALEKILW